MKVVVVSNAQAGTHACETTLLPYRAEDHLICCSNLHSKHRTWERLFYDAFDLYRQHTRGIKTSLVLGIELTSNFDACHLKLALSSQLYAHAVDILDHLYHILFVLQLSRTRCTVNTSPATTFLLLPQARLVLTACHLEETGAA